MNVLNAIARSENAFGARVKRKHKNNGDDKIPAHLVENKPVTKATVPHIMLYMLCVLVVRQILQQLNC